MAKRDKACENGHFHCSYVEGGRCVNAPHRRRATAKAYGEECSTCRGPHDPVEHSDRLAYRRDRAARGA